MGQADPTAQAPMTVCMYICAYVKWSQNVIFISSFSYWNQTLEQTLSQDDDDSYLRLLRDITKEHKLVREIVPVEDHMNPVNITLDIAYSQLVEMVS